MTSISSICKEVVEDSEKKGMMIMSEEDSKSSAQIECTVEKSNINEHKRVYVNVKGETLEECRKHFDEVRRDLSE